MRAAPKAFGVGSGFESRPTHSLNLIGGLQRLSHRRCHTFANQEVEIDRPAFAMLYAPASCKPGLLSPSHLVAGGLSAARYCASNARKADSMVIPKPAIPLRTLGPRSATQVPERWKNFGRRTAAGLPGCAAKYNSARSEAATSGEIPADLLLIINKNGNS